ACDDHAILAALAARLGFADRFTEGRTPRQWLEHLYGEWRDGLRAGGHEAPAFEEFWTTGEYRLPAGPRDFTLFEDFRRDPERHPLGTPSGRIEIYSATLAALGLADCPGHPAWLEPDEWPGSPDARRHPL
ncbi:molybdopterin oxidoreductase, partial [Streptomyces sp. MCAF7]